MILNAADAGNPAQAGGKGASLSKLVEAEFDVPAFIVLTDAGFDPNAPEKPLPALIKALPGALKALGDGPFAVRSSGRAEDGAVHSHAGQFDTVLNVAPGDVLGAASQVRASGAGDTVATYRETHGLDGDGAPAVVVQLMVPSRVSGVAFSADPVSGRRDHTVISATHGLGDQLVSGEVDGESWTIGPDDQVIAEPERPEVLNRDEALEIAALARRSEQAFDAPQDIEWSYDDARLRMLQSRAITTALRPRPFADDALVVLDNSNIVESYPGLVSALTYSFASYSYDRVYRAFVSLLGLREAEIRDNAPIFANLLARVDGRVYYNLGNWYRALALLPGFSLNRGYMETMMGVAEPLPEELTGSIGPAPARGWRRWTEMARLLRVGFGIGWQAIRLRATKARFMARLNQALGDGPDPARANLTELAQTYRQIEALLLDRWDAPLVNDFLCMIGFGASRKLMERWAGATGTTFHNDIMIGQGGIISAEPAHRIAEMAALVRARGLGDALAQGRAGIASDPDLAAMFNAYLDKFGDRCTQELKLESIPLDEDPTTLIAAIGAAAARAAKPDSGDRPAPDWAALLPSNPVRRSVLRAISSWASARVRDRENLRFERTRIFGHARRVFLAMGRELHAAGHLDDPRDVFHLTVPELLGAVEGAGLSARLQPLVDLRKGELADAQTRPDPPERILVRGAPLNAGAVRATNQRPANANLTGDKRSATGCSAGIVRGVARVIHDPARETLGPGEILVARSTDPGWIAVFANAAAIVVERGSLLSHSAIVAREMDIACVVGLSDATDWIISGEVIEVDGASGEVRKCHE